MRFGVIFVEYSVRITLSAFYMYCDSQIKEHIITL